MCACIANCIEGLKKLPQLADRSYAAERRGFGEPEPEGLLLVGHVSLRTTDLALTRSFFVDALGAQLCGKAASSDEVSFGAGASRFVLSPSPDARRWPGRFCVWVEDIQRTWDACRVFGEQRGSKIIKQAMCCEDDRKVDALLLQEPACGNLFLVNQAPKGHSLKARWTGAPGVGPENPQSLLSIMDVLRYVPQGVAPAVARFYKHFLMASAAVTDSGCRVHLAYGQTLRQTLTFKEDPSWHAEPVSEGSQVCIYLPTEAKFRIAFAKAFKAGIVCAPEGGWPAAEELGEFRIRSCVDPASESMVLELEHVIRSPRRLDGPTLAGWRWAVFGA
mmetsp:Transcript_65548/g.211416  ORF Transcript_65548/g.211416 Transcript_65548/m.211416 type:complete len:333 (-) Transcript_65548:486-1484(-)